jgi:hypothetical protein
VVVLVGGMVGVGVGAGAGPEVQVVRRRVRMKNTLDFMWVIILW